ncbi:MAG: signal peptidase I [Oscillospiraceae bacterium]|nr:signal peptidase I [Oscillospiraceae bacterium]
MSENNENIYNPGAKPKPQKKFFGLVGGLAGEILEWILWLGIAVALALFIRAHVFTLVHVSGESMEYTLENRDWLFVNKFMYSPDSANNRGDIVIFTPEHDRNPSRDVYIKRVIAVVGDTIYIDFTTGNVYLNDEVVDEPFIKDRTRAGGSFIEELTRAGEWSRETPLLIEEGYVFVMGDNRNNSTDSRALGPRPLDEVMGRAVFRLFGRLERQAPDRQ